MAGVLVPQDDGAASSPAGPVAAVAPNGAPSGPRPDPRKGKPCPTRRIRAVRTANATCRILKVTGRTVADWIGWNHGSSRLAIRWAGQWSATWSADSRVTDRQLVPVRARSCAMLRECGGRPVCPESPASVLYGTRKRSTLRCRSGGRSVNFEMNPRNSGPSPENSAQTDGFLVRTADSRSPSYMCPSAIGFSRSTSTASGRRWGRPMSCPINKRMSSTVSSPIGRRRKACAVVRRRVSPADGAGQQSRSSSSRDRSRCEARVTERSSHDQIANPSDLVV